MRYLIAMSLALAGNIAGSARSETTEAQYIAAAKRVSVHRLDKALPRMSLERWLRRLAGPNTKWSWETNDCGEASGSAADSSRDLPVCVEATATIERGVVVFLFIGIGSMATGVTGDPALFDTGIQRGDSVETPRSLSEFSRALRAARR